MSNQEQKRTLVRRTREMLDGGLEHPTHKAVIDAVVHIIKEKGVNALHLDDVLAATGLTRGALYHHFKNVDELTEGALLATYAEGVEIDLNFIRQVLATAQTFSEFKDGFLRANVLHLENNDLLKLRKLRAHAIAIAVPGSQMAKDLAIKQQRLTDEYARVISEAQERKWIRTDIEPASLAVFIQAYSFGVIVDDVSLNQLKDGSWRQMIESFFTNIVFMNEIQP